MQIIDTVAEMKESAGMSGSVGFVLPWLFHEAI